MTDTNEISRLKELRNEHTRHLHYLQKQAAQYGVAVPAHIAMGIEDVRRTIADLDRQIAALERPATPAPPRRPRIRFANPRFPVTPIEWRYHTQYLLNHDFGNPEGYWCYVPAGIYLIGGWKPGDPMEHVELPDFWIAKYPVTVQQYRRFIEEGGYKDKTLWTPEGWEWRSRYNDGKGRHHPYYWPGANEHERINVQDNQPVTTVWWNVAAAFAAWVNRHLSGTLSDGSSVRLPTEAEWEAAAAYDAEMVRRTYHWDEQEPDPQRADFDRKWDDGPVPVGEHPAGAAACGAHNLAGSVWEWCSSDYANYPSHAAVALDDFSPDDYNAPVRGGHGGGVARMFAARRGTGFFPPSTSSAAGCDSPSPLAIPEHMFCFLSSVSCILRF